MNVLTNLYRAINCPSLQARALKIQEACKPIINKYTLRRNISPVDVVHIYLTTDYLVDHAYQAKNLQNKALINKYHYLVKIIKNL